MQFQSANFIVFLVLVVATYWVLPIRWRNPLLLVSSYVFYGWIHPWFLLLIFASTVTDYYCAREMARQPSRRKRLLHLSLVANLGMLGVFKYFNFFAENVRALLVAAGFDVPDVALQVMLPVGISFYTFQTLSYTIDVYRNRLEPCQSFLDFAVYVSFFPQLVAGPIERAGALLPQVQTPRSIDTAGVRGALTLLFWGFFKKLVIADNVALIANKVFALGSPGTPLLAVGTLAFCVQIYADFSAYTDIARGCARLLGFELMVNFDHPYASQSPMEFWRRWHISLSTWLRDYLYVPLGGSRGTLPRVAFNLVVTFFLSGLWHGASWNFVVWGLYHGVLILAYRAVFDWAPRLETSRILAAPRWAVFFFFTNVGWMIFRQQDTQKLFHAFTSPAWGTGQELTAAAFLLPRVAVYAAPLILHWVLDEAASRWGWRERPTYQFGQAVAAAVALALTAAFYAPQQQEFIYFQF